MAIHHIDGSQSYVGLCVSSHNWYNSSMDVTTYYVNVYNPLTDSLESIYVYNDFDSNAHDTFTLDATDEIKAILHAKKQAQCDREEKYGPSVGFKDASGTVCWTNPDNLQVV